MGMRYNIPLPRLLDNNLNEVRRLSPYRLSVNLSIKELSNASMELSPDESVPVRSWVELFTSSGSAGIFRVRTPQVSYGNMGNRIDLDHGIAELADYIIKGELEAEMTARAAIQTIFGYYGGTHWQLGTISSTATVTLQASHENVLTAINGILDQIPNYMLSFDQTTTPWTLKVVARGNAVSTEGRLSRNVTSARITEDTSELYTRVYNDQLTGGYMDASTIGTYGVIEYYMSGDENTTASQASRMVSLFLEKHQNPALSIEIEGQDLAVITGESFDTLAIGKKYRLALPNYDRIVEETIVGLSWGDVYGQPGNVLVTLSEKDETVISFLHKQNVGGGRAGKKIQEKEAEKFKQYETHFTQTDTYFSLLATESQWDELSQTGHVTAYTEIKNTARDISLVASKTGIDGLAAGETLMSKININAGAITSEVTRATNAETSMASRITQTETAITSEVTRATKAEGTLSSKITQTSDAITAEVTRATSAEESLSSSISVNANAITTKVSKNGVISSINQTSESVTISASKINLSGYVTASELSATDAKITNLTSGETTAASLKGNNIYAINGFKLGSYWHHNSTITIDGVNYQIVTWGSGY